MPPSYHSQVLDPLGLVAGMFEELGIGEVLERAIVQDCPQRTVSLGQAVQAMGLHGLGCVHQHLSLVPSFFHNKPLERLMGPRMQAAPLTDDVLGRALDALYAYGVTPL
jgi:hypothetical protein